jgi:hypothetical protein
MPLFQGPDIHMAWVGPDIVVLDVRKDAYSCVMGGAELISPAKDGGLVTVDKATSDALVQAGLATTIAPNNRSPLPSGALSRLETPAKTSLAEVLAFLASSARHGHEYHGRSFWQIVTSAREHRARMMPVAHEDRVLANKVAAFQLGLPWVPFQGVCLHRAHMLFHFLMDAGLAPQWVFGVRTWPFSAHCWLQIDDVVLADEPDRVGLYTPILVL